MEGKKFMWMLKKDLLSLWRHKPRLVSMFLFPIIMIVLFGYGMGGTIENVPIAVVDQSHGEMTDQTLMAVKNKSLFEVKNITSNVNLAKEMVNNGEVKAAIILPPNYDDTSTDQSKMVVLYLDSSDQIASQAIVPATQGLFSQLSAQIGAEKLASLKVQNTAMNPQSSSADGSGVANTTDNSTADNSAADSSGADSSISSNVNGIVNSINLQINRIYGDIAYIDFLVPAVLAMTVMMSCMMGMGQSIAGERETGELARLFMTSYKHHNLL